MCSNSGSVINSNTIRRSDTHNALDAVRLKSSSNRLQALTLRKTGAHHTKQSCSLLVLTSASAALSAATRAALNKSSLGSTAVMPDLDPCTASGPPSAPPAGHDYWMWEAQIHSVGHLSALSEFSSVSTQDCLHTQAKVWGGSMMHQQPSASPAQLQPQSNWQACTA